MKKGKSEKLELPQTYYRGPLANLMCIDVEVVGLNKECPKELEPWADKQAKELGVSREEAWAIRAGLSGHTMILCVSFTKYDRVIESIETVSYSTYDFDDFLDQIKGKNIAFLGHNVMFDLRAIARECVRLGKKIPDAIALALDIKPWSLNSKTGNVFDTCLLMEKLFGRKVSLEETCSFLAIPSPKGSISGIDIHRTFWDSGFNDDKMKEIVEYNMRDTVATMKVFIKLLYFSNILN